MTHRVDFYNPMKNKTKKNKVKKNCKEDSKKIIWVARLAIYHHTLKSNIKSEN